MALLPISGFAVSEEYIDLRAVGEWIAAKAENVDCVIALARAGPRLLQYLGLVRQIKCPVISELALSFLPPAYFQGRSVLIFDDTITFGSTMHATRERLIVAGATVECAAIAIHEDGLVGQASQKPRHIYSDLNPSFLLKASSHQLDIIHNLEIQAFRSLGKPYMFDYPIYEVPLTPSVRDDDPKRIARKIGARADNTFIWPAIVPGGQIGHFGIPIAGETLSQLFEPFNSSVSWQEFSKLRLFIDYERLKLRVVALVQCSTDVERVLGEIENVKRSDEVLNYLLSAAAQHPLIDELRISVHRALVFAFSRSVTSIAWRSFLRPRLSEYLTDETPTFSKQDAAFLVGGELSRKLSELDKHLWASPETRTWTDKAPQISRQPSTWNGAPPVEEFSNPDLWSAIAAKLNADADCKPAPGRDAYENISYLVPVLRDVIDREQRESGDVRRLWRGLSYSDLLILLNSYGAHCSPFELSAALDEFVDNGILVPQLVVNDRSKVLRVYRSGETAPSDKTLVLKSIVRDLLAERKEQALPNLSEKGFSKLFAVLKRLFPEIPIRLKPQTYGIEPFVDDELLRSWCQQHKVIEIKGDPRLILPGDRSAGPVQWPFEHHKTLQIRLNFLYLGELDGLPASATQIAPGREMLLLLSTCNNHQAAFNACAWEMHSWFQQTRYNFDRLLSLLESADWQSLSMAAWAKVGVETKADQLRLFEHQPSSMDMSAARAAVLSDFCGVGVPVVFNLCANYLSEYQIKRHLFYTDYAKVVAALESHFSNAPDRKIYWEETFVKTGFVRGDKDPTFVALFEIMNAIEECCWRLMGLLREVVVANDWWGASKGAVESKLDQAISKYNVAIDDVHALGIEYDRLHKFEVSSVINKADVADWVSQIRERFSELRRAFEVRIPVFDKNSATPFSPSTKSDPAGVLDELLSGQYIAMFDLIQSKLAPPDVKVQVREVLRSYRVKHEPTGDDSYLFVTPNLRTAVDIIAAVRTRTLQYVTTNGYGGLRASITRGDCIARRLAGLPEDDGQLIITDRAGTPDIPNTAYQMDSIKKLLADHPDLLETQQKDGIAMSREVAIAFAGSSEVVQLKTAGLLELGRWEHKGMGGDGYFYLPNPLSSSP